MAPIALRAFKHAFKKTQNLIRARITEVVRPLNSELQPVLVRSAARHAVHPVARIRQAKGKWYTTHSTINAAVRRFMSTTTETGSKYNRSAFPISATATAVSRLTTRSAFSSTLRPNLTGGAFPRTAGGYSLGGGRAGGARYFSHTPAAPAQVLNNVSAGIRAFLVSGQKAQFDGMTPLGEKRYRSVSTLQKDTARKIQSLSRQVPGSYIDFQIHPMITSLTSFTSNFSTGSKMGQQVTPSLNDDGFLDCLAVDFSRALKDLAITMNDLKRLASLGDLPISLEGKSTLRIRFPGCDAETVERLCDEVGVQRGTIKQDLDYEEAADVRVALMFPFAPSSDPTLSSPGGSLRSQTGHEAFEEILGDDLEDNPWLESYESMEELSEGESAYFSKSPSHHPGSSDYEGVEGIYRFLEQCDAAQRL